LAENPTFLFGIDTPRCSSYLLGGAPLDELPEDPGTAVLLDCGDILELSDVLLEGDLK
jgi:hypothetical protein